MSPTATRSVTSGRSQCWKLHFANTTPITCLNEGLDWMSGNMYLLTVFIRYGLTVQILVQLVLFFESMLQ